MHALEIWIFLLLDTFGIRWNCATPPDGYKLLLWQPEPFKEFPRADLFPVSRQLGTSACRVLMRRTRRSMAHQPSSTMVVRCWQSYRSWQSSAEFVLKSHTIIFSVWIANILRSKPQQSIRFSMVSMVTEGRQTPMEATKQLHTFKYIMLWEGLQVPGQLEGSKQWTQTIDHN